MLTYYAANRFLQMLSGLIETTGFGTVFVGLSTTPPNREGGGLSEPVAPEYARVVLGIPNQTYAQRMASPVDGTVANDEVVHFPEVRETTWGTLTHFGLFTSQTGGNLLAYGEILNEAGVPTPITPGDTEIPIIRVGNLRLSIE